MEEEKYNVTIVWGNVYDRKNKRKLIAKGPMTKDTMWQRIKEAVEIYDFGFSLGDCYCRLWYDRRWVVDYGSWHNFIYVYGLSQENGLL